MYYLQRLLKKFSFLTKRKYKYILDNYDANTEYFYISSIFGRAISKRVHISKILTIGNIINLLLPEQACFIGLIAGKSEKYIYNNNLKFDDNISGIRVYQFNRDNSIKFVDLNNQAIKIRSVDLCKNRELINQFHPVAAFEIGLLAAKEAFKPAISSANIYALNINKVS